MRRPAANDRPRNRPTARTSVRNAILALAGAAFGCGTAAAETTRCAVSAYLINSDGKGTNVRSGPGTRHRILKTAPNASEAIADITGFADGWFRISHVETTGGEQDEVVFNGTGWIHRSQLHVDAAGGRSPLRSLPHHKARIVGHVVGDQPGITLLACSGDWVEVQANGVTGWLAPAGQCSNPLTTCV
jgi:SH3-like domain-containing protein